MLAFILVALLAQRGTLSRAQDTGVSTWQALKEYRPVPTELRSLTEVQAFRAVVRRAGAGRRCWRPRS